MGIGKATALIRDLRSCKALSLFLSGDDFGEFSKQVANDSKQQLPAEWLSPRGAPHGHGLAAFGSAIASLLRLPTWWVGLWARRGLSVCLSICFSLSLPCHKECEWCRRSSKALGPTPSLESNHQLWRSTGDDAVLDKMPKHQHLHPVRNPRTLCRARSCVACSCSHYSFHFAHHWGVWMCWAPATIKDISSVTTKFTITWVRWGWRRASGVTRMYLHTVTQLCQKTEICKIFVKR